MKKPDLNKLAKQYMEMVAESERKGAEACQPGCVMIGKTMVHQPGCKNFAKWLDKKFDK